ANPVEGVAECCCLHCRVVNQLADEYRAAHVRDYQSQAISRLVVRHAAFAVTHEAQLHKICSRLVEAGLHHVDNALRLRPLSVETCFDKPAVWEKIGRGCNHADVAEKHRCRCGIELCVMLRVQLNVIRLDTKCVDDLGGSDHSAPPQQCTPMRDDELRRLADHPAPQRLVEDCVVDIADQRGNVFWVGHPTL